MMNQFNIMADWKFLILPTAKRMQYNEFCMAYSFHSKLVYNLFFNPFINTNVTEFFISLYNGIQRK